MVGITRDIHPNHAPDSSGGLSIEDFLALKDPYQISPSDTIPTPWPFLQYKAAEDGDLAGMWPQIEQKCTKICATHNISIQSISIHSIWRKRFGRSSKDCVIVDTREKDTSTWLAVANDIWAHLTYKGVKAQDFTVEIRNTLKMYADVMRCFPRCSELIAYVKTVEPGHKAQVDGILPAWTSIAYYGRAPRIAERGLKPTIVLTVRPRHRAPFRAIEDAVKKLLDREEWKHVVLHVEILVGVVELC